MWDSVEQLLYEGVEQNLFSGCSLCIRNIDEELYVGARGMEQRTPEQHQGFTTPKTDLKTRRLVPREKGANLPHKTPTGFSSSTRARDSPPQPFLRRKHG